jgi:hypothetical protein
MWKSLLPTTSGLPPKSKSSLKRREIGAILCWLRLRTTSRTTEEKIIG